MRGEVWAGEAERRGAAAAQAARTGPTECWGSWHTRRAHTWNMPTMCVTFDVSRLSGWLNTDAPCRVETR